jgi:hypothetical protein
MGEQRRKYQAQDGFEREVIFDSDIPDKFVIKTSQDIEPVLDAIAASRDVQQKGANRKIATLPIFIVEDLIHRGIYYDEDRFKVWLNSAEATPWRTWRGRV